MVQTAGFDGESPGGLLDGGESSKKSPKGKGKHKKKHAAPFSMQSQIMKAAAASATMQSKYEGAEEVDLFDGGTMQLFNRRGDAINPTTTGGFNTSQQNQLFVQSIREGTTSAFYSSQHTSKFRQTPKFEVHLMAQALLNTNKQGGKGNQVPDTLRISKDSFYSSFFSSKRFGFQGKASKQGDTRGGGFKLNLNRADSKDSIHMVMAPSNMIQFRKDGTAAADETMRGFS